MNEAVLAKFLLQYGMNVEEFFEDKFIDSDFFPECIHQKISDFSGNYIDIVKEEVEESIGDCVFNDEDNTYTNPDTGEEIVYDDWSDWWDDICGEVSEELENDFMVCIEEEIGSNYEEIMDLFLSEVHIYLQEALDDEWHNYR